MSRYQTAAPPRSSLLIILACALGLCLAASARAQPEGVSYTITPAYDVLQWDNEVGLEDTELYGGRLGISFGKLAALQGYYLERQDVRTRLAELGLPGAGGQVTDRALDISTYGVDVVLRLGTGNVVPFLRGGGGVLTFRPDSGDEVRQISMKAGGGVRLGFRRFQVEVFAEDLAFRVDRFQLAEPPEGGSHPVDPDADQVRHNLSVGAGLTFFLGGTNESRLSETDRALLERYRQGLSGLSVPVEPFVGRLDFNDRLMIDDQLLAGLRTGLDFGRFFGLRGYYWRGVNDGLDEIMPIQSWGGEARFILNSGQGAVPYLVTGVGHLDFMDDFRDGHGMTPDDKTLLILGGGLAFRLNSRLEMDLSARDYILSAESLDDTSTPDDLLGNWMFGAAVRFVLGGSSAPGRRPPVDTAAEKDAVAVAEKTAATGYAGERMITIPVPTEGEIYIRYGSPGGVSIESQSAAGESGAAEAPPGSSAPVPPVALPSTQVVAPALDLDTIRQVVRDELIRAGVVREWGAVAPDADRVGTVGEEPSMLGRTINDEESPGLRPEGFRAYMGLGVGDHDQFVLGGRLDLGRIFGRSRLHPELAIGFGGDATTFLAAANLHLPFGEPGGSGQWSPYVYGGLGLLVVDGGAESGTDLTVNLGLGVDARFGDLTPYLEYQGIRGFDVNRLLVGLRFGE